MLLASSLFLPLLFFLPHFPLPPSLSLSLSHSLSLSVCLSLFLSPPSLSFSRLGVFSFKWNLVRRRHLWRMTRNCLTWWASWHVRSSRLQLNDLTRKQLPGLLVCVLVFCHCRRQPLTWISWLSTAVARAWNRGIGTSRGRQTFVRCSLLGKTAPRTSARRVG